MNDKELLDEVKKISKAVEEMCGEICGSISANINAMRENIERLLEEFKKTKV